MSTQIGDLIQRARAHHPAFNERNHPNVVLVQYLSTRHRELLKGLVESMKDRLSEARRIADTISNSLVGVDSDGNAYSVTTSGDGYDVIVENGFLYTGPTAIATDPYTAGFVLPATSLKLIDIYATMLNTARYEAVIVVPERDIGWRSGSGSKLFAFINGWRLMTIRNPPSNTGQSMWDNVEYVTVVWVDQPVRFTMTGTWRTQTLALADTYGDALEYDLAAYMARRETGRNADFPRDFAAGAAEEAQKAYSRTAEGARRDHQPVRYTQVRRNR